MHTPLMPMLAFGTVELIIIVIFLAISAVRWILREMQKASEMREQRQRRLEAERQGQFSDTHEKTVGLDSLERNETSRTSSGESLEEIAARRRREIAAMNRSGSPDPNQPNNLTMQQMRERAAAKSEYQRRVEALRQKQTTTSVRSAPGHTAPTQRRPVPLDLDDASLDQTRRDRQILEQQDQARVKAEAQRQAQMQKQRQAAAQQQQRHRQIQMQSLRKTTSARPATPSLRTHAIEDESVEGPRRSSVTGARELSERTAAAVSSSGPRAHVNLSQGNVMLTAKSLRDVVILREILDPPVTLREPA